MPIFRLISAIAIIWLLFYVYRRIHKLVANKRQSTITKITETNNMIRCQRCGLHIPSTEAVQQAGHYYCCQEHADHQ